MPVTHNYDLLSFMLGGVAGAGGICVIILTLLVLGEWRERREKAQ